MIQQFTTPNSGRNKPLQETNYENAAGNYLENEKSDSDGDMISDVEFNDDSDIE